MPRPVTLSDRARGYGLWPGDVLARLPGARIQNVSLRYDEQPSLVVALALAGDTSPVPEVPVRMELVFRRARLRTWRPGWRERLRRRVGGDRPEVVELVRARFGRYRLLHSAGRLVVRAEELVVDVRAASPLTAVPDTVADDLPDGTAGGDLPGVVAGDAPEAIADDVLAS